VNLVNGMIVDGLGHVSLDSGAPGSAQANNTLSQANIHQGSIPATGRIKAQSQASVAMSAANSLQFNQLIGGAISPSVISSQQIQNGGGAASNSSGSRAVFTSAVHAGAASAAAASPNAHNQPHLMIGDYVQGNMGNVLGNAFRHQ